MTDFVKPGSREWDYPDMARESIEAALSDADVGIDEVERAFAAYCYGESTAGQRALYGVGMTGIPVVNVNNACATGSSALFLARETVRTGIAECVLAFGFEKMATGSLGASYADRAFPIDTHIAAITDLRGTWEPSPPSPQLFGAAGREHMERYGSTPEHFAAVASKNHLHSTRNPRAQFQKPFSVDEVLASPPVYEPLTRLQCSPTSDGSAAALVASADDHAIRGHGR